MKGIVQTFITCPMSMHCKACHSGARLHGDGTESDTRYSASNPVSCRTCHSVGSENAYHATHAQTFQCQVCHAQDYKNCTDCHAGTGLQQPSTLGFKIGRNPIPGQRSAEYVVLRHIPVSEQTYADWGVTTSELFRSAHIQVRYPAQYRAVVFPYRHERRPQLQRSLP